MILPLTNDHLAAVSAIQTASYPAQSREDMETLQYHWNAFPEFCLLGLHQGVSVGYLIAHPWPPRLPPPLNALSYQLPPGATSLFIHDLALLPAARGTGLATSLVETLLTRAKLAGLPLASLVSVQGTRGFWERFGFQPVTSLPPDYFDAFRRYYQDGGFLYMEKEL
jgi:GNAT superfamily N-acetyltransferase